MSHHSGSKTSTLISNPIISRLTKTNVYLYYIVYLILTLLFLFHSMRVNSLTKTIAGILTGILIWSFVEYLLHRFFFHWKPRNKLEKIIVFIVHDVHHDNPRDVSRAITPLTLSLPLAALFYFLFIIIFGNFTFAIYPGFLLGYTTYSIIHHCTHHSPMNYLFVKNLKRHHMHHHFFDNSRNFGVTTTFWDYIFRTHSRIDDEGCP